MATVNIKTVNTVTYQSTGYNSRHPGAVSLGGNKIMVIFNNSNTTYARVGYREGTTVSWGTQVAIDTSALNCSIQKLTNSLVVIAYRDNGSPYNHRLRACTISGTTITVGAESALGANDGHRIGMCRVSDTVFAAFYRLSSNIAYVRAGSISGTTISLGSATSCTDSGSMGSPCTRITALDTSTLIIAYYYSSATSISRVQKFGISGTTVTEDVSSRVNISGDNAMGREIEAINSTQFIIFYMVGSPTKLGSARIGTWTGSAITFGSAVQIVPTNNSIYNGESLSLDIDKVNERAIFAWVNGIGVSYGSTSRAVGAAFDTGSIVLGDPISVANDMTYSTLQVAVMPDNEYLIAYDKNTDGAFVQFGTYEKTIDDFSGNAELTHTVRVPGTYTGDSLLAPDKKQQVIIIT